MYELDAEASLIRWSFVLVAHIPRRRRVLYLAQSHCVAAVEDPIVDLGDHQAVVSGSCAGKATAP